jgi:hypothetical protein
MREMEPLGARPITKSTSAFTLAEVVMAIGIAAMVFGGMILAYTQANQRAQWTGYSLAAQALAIQQIEQIRAASWNLFRNEDQSFDLGLVSSNLTYFTAGSVNGANLAGYTWTNLDIPYSGTNWVRATNFVTVRLYSNLWSGTTARIRMIQVDTVWPFRWGNTNRFFTNTLCSYYAPDN